MMNKTKAMSGLVALTGMFFTSCSVLEELDSSMYSNTPRYPSDAPENWPGEGWPKQLSYSPDGKINVGPGYPDYTPYLHQIHRQRTIAYNKRREASGVPIGVQQIEDLKLLGKAIVFFGPGRVGAVSKGFRAASGVRTARTAQAARAAQAARVQENAASLLP